MKETYFAPEVLAMSVMHFRPVVSVRKPFVRFYVFFHEPSYYPACTIQDKHLEAFKSSTSKC